MTDAAWRRSSYSGTNGNCVEVNKHLDAVRDSKSPEVAIAIGRDVFDRFIAAIKKDEIGRT